MMSIGLLHLGGCTTPLLGPVTTQPTAVAEARSLHWDWSRCLHDLVRSGRVHYARLSANPARLDRMLRCLAVSALPGDSGPARKAAFINAYNAFALRAGLECYLASGGDPDRVRAPRETEYRFRLHGRAVTLADVRTRLMAGGPVDPRVLLALCPATADIPLWYQAFAPDTVEAQLTTVAAAAINDPAVVRIDHENRVLRVANVIGRNRDMLVKWYEQRTGAKGARLLNALLDLADDTGRKHLNTAVGYPVTVEPWSRRLNLYVPPVMK
jgi:hypothetical protein